MLQFASSKLWLNVTSGVIFAMLLNEPKVMKPLISAGNGTTSGASAAKTKALYLQFTVMQH